MRVGLDPSLATHLRGQQLSAALLPLLDRPSLCVRSDDRPAKHAGSWRTALAVLFLVSALPSYAARPFTMTVERNATCNNGEVTGRLLVAGSEVAKTLELPWRNNEEDISQIPPGSYPAYIRSDGLLGWRVELRDVPDRDNVQLHIGNYSRQTKGCILLGTRIAISGGTCATESSGAALEVVREAMQKASADGVSSQQLAITVVVR
jgi:hypothetical protein